MSGLNWQPLLQMALDAEQKYLNILNKAHNTNHTKLKNALYELYSIHYQSNNLIPEKRTGLETQYRKDVLYNTVSVIHLALNNGKLVDNIIDPEAWSSENKKSQKLMQLKNARNNLERGGYINEVIIAEHLIHAIKTQYPDKDFQVRVTNSNDGDFTVFFDSSKQIKNLKTTYRNDPKSFNKALEGMEHIPFDAKTNLGFFAITETKELGKTDQNKILEMLVDTAFEKTISASVEYEDIPKEYLDPNSEYYYSELEKGERIEVVYYVLPRSNIHKSVLYHLLYKKLKKGVPIFIGEHSHDIDFVLASEIIQRYIKNSMPYGGLLCSMEDTEYQTLYTDEPEEKAKEQLYREYLQKMIDIKIIGGK